MYTIEYDFLPNSEVFVLVDGNQIETGTVMSMSFKLYLDDNNDLQEEIEYRILLDDLELGSAKVSSVNIYGTLEEAAANIVP
jgi:hypothetical protein